MSVYKCGLWLREKCDSTTVICRKSLFVNPKEIRYVYREIKNTTSDDCLYARGKNVVRTDEQALKYTQTLSKRKPLEKPFNPLVFFSDNTVIDSNVECALKYRQERLSYLEDILLSDNNIDDSVAYLLRKNYRSFAVLLRLYPYLDIQPDEDIPQFAVEDLETLNALSNKYNIDLIKEANDAYRNLVRAEDTDRVLTLAKKVSDSSDLSRIFL